jgi:hypothetical protein
MGWNKMGVGIILLAVGFLLIAQSGVLAGQGLPKLFSAGLDDSDSTSGSGSNVNPNVNPSATYTTVDRFGNTVVGGTAYYKRDGLSAGTTALSNVNPGTKYTYWVSNSTAYYVKPFDFVAGTLNNDIVNKNAYQNGSATVILFDSVNNVNVQTANNNVTMGAGATVNLAVKYQGTFQRSAMPFGGVLVVEKNTSIAQVTCTGADIGSASGSPLSYTVSSTANDYVVFSVSPSLDDGTSSVRDFNCQFKNGASDSSSNVKFTFIPYNWYVGNDGNFYLDAQKNANSDTARTGLGTVTANTIFI